MPGVFSFIISSSLKKIVPLESAKPSSFPATENGWQGKPAHSISKSGIDCASIEKLYFFKNQKTIIPVAEARGVILAALQRYSIPIYEYTPIEVKQVLTGYGRASKKEVESMVRLTLGVENLPKLDDTVDAIAIAICHQRNLKII